MDAGGDLGSTAKGLAIGLEVAGSGPVICRFFHSLLLAMCSSLACLSFTMVRRPSSLILICTLWQGYSQKQRQLT